MREAVRWLFFPLLLIIGGGICTAVGQEVSHSRVEVAKGEDGSFFLRRNGQAYLIKGVGLQGGSLQLLAKCGGNSVRTWAVESLSEPVDGKSLLDRCQELGLTVTVGLWVKHERHGFNYQDQESVRRQREEIVAAVRRYKNHPAVLMWGLGNEMDGPMSDGANAPVWSELNELAALIKKEDPNHPVMTAVGGLSPLRMEYIRKYYPNLDVLGVNTYGLAASIPGLLRNCGWQKPFVLTEFGPLGHWEVPRTAWGAPIEPSGGQKARTYAANYQAVMKDGAKTCLGTYAFIWGYKQEVTPTWYGMMTPAGEKLPVVDAMGRIWSGHSPPNPCPEIEFLRTPLRETVVAPDSEATAIVKASGAGESSLTYEWTISDEIVAPKEGGDFQPPPKEYPQCILKTNGDGSVLIKIPSRPGPYRLFVTVRDGKGGAAAENVPFLVVRPSQD